MRYLSFYEFLTQIFPLINARFPSSYTLPVLISRHAGQAARRSAYGGAEGCSLLQPSVTLSRQGVQETVIIGLLFLVIFGPNQRPVMVRGLRRFVSGARYQHYEYKSEITSTEEENRKDRHRES